MEKGITIGVAGHVDHGKTSLVKALSGIDTDRMKVEKERGLSIESGVAPLVLPSGRQVALVDVPGHTDYLKNTIRGLSGVDLAIFVIAADDGVMPQSREHLEILKFFGARGGVCVLTKADLVDEETLDLAELELQEILPDSFLHGRPVVRFSTKTGQGVTEILDFLEAQVRSLPKKDGGGDFRLWIDRIKRIVGLGTVVSGTVASGSAAVNDTVLVQPGRIFTRIRSMESHNQPVKEVFAGQRVGLNLHNVPAGSLKRGMLVAALDAGEGGYLLNVDLHLIPSAVFGLKNRQRVKLYIGTAVVGAMVVLMEKARLDPGDRALTQFRLQRPLFVFPRDRFVIVAMNLPMVLGGGKVLEIPSEKFRQAKKQRILPYLEALRTGDIAGFVDTYFDAVVETYTDARTLSQITGLSQKAFQVQISARVQSGAFVYLKRHGAYPKEKFERIRKKMLRVIESVFRENPLKKNINRIELMNLLDDSMDDFLFVQLVESLCLGGKLEKIGGGYVPGQGAANLSADQDQLLNQLLDFAKVSGLNPFSADTFWKKHNRIHEKETIQKLLNYLDNRKKLIRLNDQRFLSLDALDDIKDRVEQFIHEKGCVRLSDCKAILGYGRWGCVHVFDYLDEIGFTTRRGDKRVLRQPKS